jgi:hypothetical protein
MPPKDQLNNVERDLFPQQAVSLTPISDNEESEESDDDETEEEDEEDDEDDDDGDDGDDDDAEEGIADTEADVENVPSPMVPLGMTWSAYLQKQMSAPTPAVSTQPHPPRAKDTKKKPVPTPKSHTRAHAAATKIRTKAYKQNKLKAESKLKAARKSLRVVIDAEKRARAKANKVPRKSNKK